MTDADRIEALAYYVATRVPEDSSPAARSSRGTPSPPSPAGSLAAASRFGRSPDSTPAGVAWLTSGG